MIIRLAAVGLAVSILSCGPAADHATPPGAATEAKSDRPADPTPAPIQAALDGRAWRLTHFDRDDAVPEAIVITLGFEAGRIGGSAGCNRYFAAVTEGDRPGEITIGPVGATRMACPEEVMNAESRFLDALAHVVSYDLAGEGLALTSQQEAGRQTLLFAPAGAGS